MCICVYLYNIDINKRMSVSYLPVNRIVYDLYCAKVACDPCITPKVIIKLVIKVFSEKTASGTT